MIRRWGFFSLAGVLLATLGSVAAADLNVHATAPPECVSAAVREALEQQAHQVRIDGELEATFWFRRDTPEAESVSSQLGVNFSKLSNSDLLGVVEFKSEWSDYKAIRVRPGVYTLRYQVQPADGNHMGVSQFRDFFILIPAELDEDPQARYSYAELMALSTQASGVTHPASMALFPVYEDIAEAKLFQDDLGQWTLARAFNSTVIGVVVTGQGKTDGF